MKMPSPSLPPGRKDAYDDEHLDGDLRPGTTRASGGEGYETGNLRRGRGSGGYVGFDTSRGNRPVTMRVGLSYTSARAAEANLRAEVGRPAAFALAMARDTEPSPQL